MLGAIAGDIIGSRFEWNNIKTTDFELFAERSRPTDDSVMTCAVAQALLDTRPAEGEPWDAKALAQAAVERMRELGWAYPRAGYGGRFRNWLIEEEPRPYNSWGNGSAMRVSPAAWAARSLEEALALSDAVTAVTHNHPEGLKGARATAGVTWLARTGADKAALRAFAGGYYDFGFTIEEIRPSYKFDVSCQGSLPPALAAFFEGGDYEDVIRRIVSIGGDCDTTAAIAGAMAEGFFGMPPALRAEAMARLPERLAVIVEAFEEAWPARIAA